MPLRRQKVAKPTDAGSAGCRAADVQVLTSQPRSTADSTTDSTTVPPSLQVCVAATSCCDLSRYRCANVLFPQCKPQSCSTRCIRERLMLPQQRARTSCLAPPSTAAPPPASSAAGSRGPCTKKHILPSPLCIHVLTCHSTPLQGRSVSASSPQASQMCSSSQELTCHRIKANQRFAGAVQEIGERSR